MRGRGCADAPGKIVAHQSFLVLIVHLWQLFPSRYDYSKSGAGLHQYLKCKLLIFCYAAARFPRKRLPRPPDGRPNARKPGKGRKARNTADAGPCRARKKEKSARPAPRALRSEDPVQFSRYVSISFESCFLTALALFATVEASDPFASTTERMTVPMLLML